MARSRLLKPQFFKNDLLAECQPLSRLLFAGLWCMADAEGRLEYRPARVKAEVLPYDDCDVDQLVDELEHRGFVRKYSAGGLTILVIVKFLDHQRPHPKEPTEQFPEEEKSTSEAVSEKPGKEISRNLKVRTSRENKLPEMYDCAFNPFPFNPLILLSPTESATLPKRQSQTATITWLVDEGWQGITDADRSAWATAYPAATLVTELAKASEWLKANPTKAHRKNWRKFLSGWLSRCQDGGGTDRGTTNGRQPFREPDKPCRPWTGSDDDRFAATRKKLAEDLVMRGKEI